MNYCGNHVSDDPIKYFMETENNGTLLRAGDVVLRVNNG